MPSEILKEAIRITSEGEERAIWDRRLFLSACVLLILVLLATVNVDIFFPTFSAVVILFLFSFMQNFHFFIINRSFFINEAVI